MNKNVFFDLGTHMGQGLNYFIGALNINKNWDVFSYEANPVTYQKFQESQDRIRLQNSVGAVFHNQAISDEDNLVTINLETPPNGDDTGMGSSIMDLNHWNPWGDEERNNFKKQYIVQSVDFSTIVASRAGDNIFCKMDIEGAEFQVLNKMIKDDTLRLISTIWIEFHDHYFVDKNEMLRQKNAIMDYVNKNNLNNNVRNWH